MKATAKAPSNIAFIKYWGKADDQLRLPLNSSFSMNLSEAFTITTVEFSKDYSHDEVSLFDGNFSEKEKSRVGTHLDRMREKAGVQTFAKVVTKNSFPKGTGIASSASGFAALTAAAAAALELTLAEKELAILARLGSGSACRSIPDGFVIWEKGSDSDSSYAHSIFPADYWDLVDIVCVVDSQQKKVSTTGGMEQIQTSPFLKNRLSWVEKTCYEIKGGFAQKDFEKVGALIEREALNMHAVMLTQSPALLYWTQATLTVINAVWQLRASGMSAYFTLDAGPNVHVICEGKNIVAVQEELKKITEIKQFFINKPADGTKLVSQHLF